MRTSRANLRMMLLWPSAFANLGRPPQPNTTRGLASFPCRSGHLLFDTLPLIGKLHVHSLILSHMKLKLVQRINSRYAWPLCIPMHPCLTSLRILLPPGKNMELHNATMSPRMLPVFFHLQSSGSQQLCRSSIAPVVSFGDLAELG